LSETEQMWKVGRKFEGNRHLGDLGLDGRIILKYIEH